MPCRNQTGMEEANTDCDHPPPPPPRIRLFKKKQEVRSENCKGSPTPSIQYISRPNIMRWRKISNLSLSLSLFDFGVYGCNNNKYAGRWKQGWKKRSKTKQTNPGKKKKKPKQPELTRQKNQNKTKTERTNKLYYIYIHETKQEKKAKKKKKNKKCFCVWNYSFYCKVRSELCFSFRVFHANHLLRPVITICWRCVFVCFFFFKFLWFSDLFSVYG